MHDAKKLLLKQMPWSIKGCKKNVFCDSKVSDFIRIKH